MDSRLLLIPGLQSSPGPGTHTQSPVWGSQEWFGGHEQVWAQLMPNVPVWHTTKTNIWQNVCRVRETYYRDWSRNKNVFSAENHNMRYFFRNHIQEIWKQSFRGETTLIFSFNVIAVTCCTKSFSYSVILFSKMTKWHKIVLFSEK